MIGIVGAGISGLSLAYELQKQNKPYVLLEASQQPGGYIQSKRVGAYLIELGPNSLLVGDELMDWLQEFDQSSELQAAQDISKSRFIYRDGKYRALPSGPLSLISNTFFSLSTKWAIFREFRKKPEIHEEESLSHFFSRRFTREMVDYALTPFVTGIYAGDPEQLLIKQTFPRIWEYEQEYGSILKGFIKNKGGGRKKSFTFREGLATLPQMIARKIQNLRYAWPVENIEKQEGGYVLHSGADSVQVSQVVLACSTSASAKLLQALAPDWSLDLQKVNYAPMVAVHSAYARSAVKHPLNGFGGLHPKVENLYTAGSIWSSSTFTGRCPQDEVLLTTFVGGMLNQEKASQPEEKIREEVHKELAQLYGISEKPRFQHFFPWEKAIPQYDRNILPALAHISAWETQNLFVYSNWKDGVSLADRMLKAREMANQLGT